MDTKNLIWCLNLKKGIKLVNPDIDLSDKYMAKAGVSFEVTKKLKKYQCWAITAAYYSMYFGLYSILAKIGIKCENHFCSLELMRTMLEGYFSNSEFNLVVKARKLNIDTEQYPDKEISISEYKGLMKVVPVFLVKCRLILNGLSIEQINDIRNEINGLRLGSEQTRLYDAP